MLRNESPLSYDEIYTDILASGELAILSKAAAILDNDSA